MSDGRVRPGRHSQALISARIEYRSKVEQRPPDTVGRQILDRIRAYFADRPTDFEHFAAHLWQTSDGHVCAYEVTRAAVDGRPGRDRRVPHRARR
jgi:hypothetical protein